MERWKEALTEGTPVYAYVGCSPQTGQYLGLEEYRAAAANALGSGGDGVYLFNYPCLFELASQMPHRLGDAGIELPDMRGLGHPHLTNVARALEELGSREALRHKDKRFLFNWSNDTRHRHYAPELASIDRGPGAGSLGAVFRCYEEYDRARELRLSFKVENVARSETFEITLNGHPIEPADEAVTYAANGRDTRVHTVKLGPYLRYDVSLEPDQLKKGENALEVRPARLIADLAGKIRLVEIELSVRYG